MAEIADDGGSSKKKGGKKSHAKKQSTRVDMTPMVDLGFLLITFFMLTTTFSKPQTMELNMPDKTQDDKQQSVKATQSLTIILGENDKVFYYTGTMEEAKGKILTTDFSKDGIRKIVMDKTKELGAN